MVTIDTREPRHWRAHLRPDESHATRSALEILAVTPSLTEITVLGGQRYGVEGEAKDVDRLIRDAARGSIMQFAWLTDAQSGELLGINPECVVMLRALGS